LALQYVPAVPIYGVKEKERKNVPRKLLFENKVCSRCGGSGEYSYCSMYGRVCFKCGGAGAVLTKRGHAAQAMLNAARKKPARDIVVGETIMIDGIPGFSASRWAKVIEITGTGKERTIVAAAVKNGERHSLQGFDEFALRVAQSKERLAALKAEALAYQETLTKTGKPRKRAAAKPKEEIRASA